MKLTETESIFCQALAMTSLLRELSKDFLNSEYYQKLRFSDNNENYKTILSASGIGNPATMQMFLYVLLVMPKEILKGADKSYESQCASEINLLISVLIKSSNLMNEIQTTYPRESKTNLESIDFYRHIRNAVSHSRCSYKTTSDVCYVTFEDTNPAQKSKCEFTLKTGDVGKILTVLQKQLMTFLNMDKGTALLS